MSITNQKFDKSYEERVDAMAKTITNGADQNFNTDTPSLAEVVRNACALIKEKKVPSTLEVPSDKEILNALQGVLNGIENQEEKTYSSDLLDPFVSAKKEKWKKGKALISRHFRSKPKKTQKNIESAEMAKVMEEFRKIEMTIRKYQAFTHKQYMCIKYLHQNHYHESLLPEDIIRIITWKGESLNIQQKLDMLEKRLQISGKDFANVIPFSPRIEDMKEKALLEQKLKDLDF